MPLLPEAKNCDVSVKKNFRRISRELGYTGTPSFKSITLTDLIASRLVATDSGKVFESVTDLTNWIVGTGNQVIVTVLAGGKVTLSTPQDIHVDAHMELAGLTIKDSGDNIIFYVDDDEMYFTASVVIPIEAGMVMGLWMFWGTYASP
jgi:hypothetical protein